MARQLPPGARRKARRAQMGMGMRESTASSQPTAIAQLQEGNTFGRPLGRPILLEGGQYFWKARYQFSKITENNCLGGEFGFTMSQFVPIFEASPLHGWEFIL